MKKRINKTTYILCVIFSIGYNLFPIDLIPDVIPVIGAIDDVIVSLVPLIMGYKNISKPD